MRKVTERKGKVDGHENDGQIWPKGGHFYLFKRQGEKLAENIILIGSVLFCVVEVMDGKQMAICIVGGMAYVPDSAPDEMRLLASRPNCLLFLHYAPPDGLASPLAREERDI